jgi:hypothetical protein
MKLKVIQSQVGRFDLVHDTQSYVFKLGIVDNEGNIITKDGTKALLVYRGEPNEKHDFEDSMEELDWVYEQCWKYANSFIYSSDNYIAQCIVFWEVYINNHDLIDYNYASDRKSNIEKQIERLQNQLKNMKALPDLDWTGHFVFQKERTKYEACVSECEEVLKQLVKGTEMYEDENKRLEHYQQLTDKYNLLVEKSGC